jgi:hypothetical protein
LWAYSQSGLYKKLINKNKIYATYTVELKELDKAKKRKTEDKKDWAIKGREKRGEDSREKRKGEREMSERKRKR